MGEIEDAIESTIEERLKHFEWYLCEKYGLAPQNNLDLAGYFTPNSSASTEPITPKASPNMYDKTAMTAMAVKAGMFPNGMRKPKYKTESGLQTDALETMCYIGRYSNQTLRSIWESGEQGQAAVRVFAKSQHSISGTAAIVVSFYEGEA